MTLRLATAGESHGPGLTAILSGLPAGLVLAARFLQVEMLRRQKGYGRGGRMKIEDDRVAQERRHVTPKRSLSVDGSHTSGVTSL